MKKPLSYKLKNYNGANPFSEIQSRNFGDKKIVKEFYPTSLYKTLFNEQHEILLGTRGSGKTVLLKMLTYTCIEMYKDATGRDLTDGKSFFGFYVPTHLEFIKSIVSKSGSPEEEVSNFNFAFNCSAVKSLLAEVAEFVRRKSISSLEKAVIESKVIENLCSIWCPDKKNEVAGFQDLIWHIEKLYFGTKNSDEDNKTKSLFSKALLSPIVPTLPRIAQLIGLDEKETRWIVCIDEAEVLSELYIKCINSFLRSEKKPITIKMATLPFKHMTKETLYKNVSVEPNGNDFNYQIIDFAWDSADFKELTNHLCKLRLKDCDVMFGEDLTLENFLGFQGNDDLTDYFVLEMGASYDKDKILEEIAAALSPQRQANFDKVKEEKNKIEKPYFRRFEPVYFVRKMKAESRRGNRTVGWFAGPQNIRKIADGNPRRFLQMMNDLVEAARKNELTFKEQHRTLVDYCKRFEVFQEGIQEYGVLVKRVVEVIGNKLSFRVHGDHMLDGGCNFHVDAALIEKNIFREVLEACISYSLIIVDPTTVTNGISHQSEFRLSFIYGVVFWLPMRKGDGPIISQLKDKLNLFSESKVPATQNEANNFMKELELDLKETDE